LSISLFPKERTRRYNLWCVTNKKNKVSCWNLLDTYIHGFISWWNLMEGRERDHLTWWMKLNRIPTDDSGHPGELDRLHPMEWNSFRASWALGEASWRERDLLLGHGHHPSVDKSKVNNVKLGVHKHKSCLASYWATDFQTRQTCAFFRLQRIPSQMVIRVSTTANLQQDGYGSSSNDKHEASCTVQQNNNSSSMCLYPLALFFIYCTIQPSQGLLKLKFGKFSLEEGEKI